MTHGNSIMPIFNDKGNTIFAEITAKNIFHSKNQPTCHNNEILKR
jgi:hypothetical protein